MKREAVAVSLVLAIAGFVGVLRGAGADTPAGVVVVPIAGTVDEGMAHMVSRAVDEANARGESVVLDVNTPGGLVQSAFEIRDALFAAKRPTYAYVSERAYSAGALITLAAQHIAMAPGASIGAAEPIPKTPKTVAALESEFAATAARNHRDPTLAKAMVDVAVDAPGFKRSGAILSLTADEARRANLADVVAPTLALALDRFGLANAVAQTASYTLGERLARFATSPEASGLLLTIGVMGLIIEMQTLHGIAGLLGIGAFALFFGSHVYAGFSDPFVVALAIAGLLGILLELHVLPGGGVAGTLGVLALLAAIVLSFNLAFLFVAVQAISIAIVLSAIAFYFTSRIFPESAFVRRLVFTGSQGADYVTSADLRSLVGVEGTAVSYLRPAGVADLAGRRIDVLTEGDFVEAGSRIRVMRVEGARVFVRPAVGAR